MKNHCSTGGSVVRFNHPYVLMILLLLLWGSFAAVSALTLDHVDNFQVLFYMFGSALVMMTVLLFRNNHIAELKALKLKEWTKLSLYALPSFLYYVFYMISLQMIPAVEASMLNYLFPIMIVLLAVPINGEKLNTIKLLSVGLGFVGMVIIITNGNLQSIKLSNVMGDLFAIVGAVMWGLFSNLGKRNQINSFVSNYIYTGISFILSIICLLVFSELQLPNLQATVGLLWLGLSNIVLAYYIWFKVLKSSSIILVSSFSFVTPFVNLLFIMVLLNESISVNQLIGLAVIAIGIYMVTRTNPPRHFRATPWS